MSQKRLFEQIFTLLKILAETGGAGQTFTTFSRDVVQESL